ncbi:MAG: class I SAM-dependent methyltransferase [Alphaproteobacteria bacterium]|nr:class I SAM-dependent methyltransferase [Alphaproteobacteria bacterium]
MVPHTAHDEGLRLVVTRGALEVRWRDQAWRWHPGMAHTLAAAGAAHPWVRLGELRPGDRVVDCTLGLGVDACFLADWTGERVLGIEISPIVATLAEEGLADRAVDVVQGDATAVLAALPPGSVDVVIADPMFPADVQTRSTSLDLLHALGHPASLDHAWLAQAQRVARRAVLLKDAAGNDLLERLGAPVIRQRRDRWTRWGAWRRGPEGW